MARVSEILSALETIAPSRYAFPFDKVGLQVGDSNQEIDKAVVSMDPSLAAVEFGKAHGAQLLLAHHPLIFNPLNAVTAASHQGKVVRSLVKADMSFIAAHTNWDSAKGGINDTLASLFDLKSSEEFGTGSEIENLKLVVFVPVGDEDKIIDAATKAGAGVIGTYRRCAFTQAGTGTFEADPSSSPTVGNAGERTSVEEIRIEMRLHPSKQRAVERAVRKAHPYEEPAIDFVELAPTVEQAAGRLCVLPEQTTLGELTQRVATRLGLATWTWGAKDKVIKKVAFVGGAADGEWMYAQRAGADVLVTGEVKQHVALEASESGFALIAAGHYATEHPGCVSLLTRMQEAIPGVEWLLYEPVSGQSGRPY